MSRSLAALDHALPLLNDLIAETTDPDALAHLHHARRLLERVASHERARMAERGQTEICELDRHWAKKLVSMVGLPVRERNP